MSSRMTRDGSRDFDVLFGAWTVRNRRLAQRLKGSTEWEEFSSICHARPVLGGLGNMDEFTLDTPSGQVLAVTVRLYDAVSGEWSIYWSASTGRGRFDVPMVGRFEGTRGEFHARKLFRSATS